MKPDYHCSSPLQARECFPSLFVIATQQCSNCHFRCVCQQIALSCRKINAVHCPYLSENRFPFYELNPSSCTVHAGPLRTTDNGELMFSSCKILVDLSCANLTVLSTVVLFPHLTSSNHVCCGVPILPTAFNCL